MVDFSSPLSRRERQVLDVVLRAGPAETAEIRGALPGPPSGALVSEVLSSLVRKGHVREEREGGRNVFRSAAPEGDTLQTFAGRVGRDLSGTSPAAVVEALIAASEPPTVEELEALIRIARKSRIQPWEGKGWRERHHGP